MEVHRTGTPSPVGPGPTASPESQAPPPSVDVPTQVPCNFSLQKGLCRQMTERLVIRFLFWVPRHWVRTFITAIIELCFFSLPSSIFIMISDLHYSHSIVRLLRGGTVFSFIFMPSSFRHPANSVDAGGSRDFQLRRTQSNLN